MNFRHILVIVYLFGEFGCIKCGQNSRIAVSEVQITGESPEKIKQIEYVNKKAADLVYYYRMSKQEPARIKAEERKKMFESQTHTTLTNNKPQYGRKSIRLWTKAKEAEDKYEKIKHDFEHEKFCYPPMSDDICARVFENPYFEREKLSFDYSVTVPDNGCIRVRSSLQNDRILVEYGMEYKSCYAKRKHFDGTESALKVYLQSAYKQPFIGGYKFFVLFMYFLDEKTKQWVRPSDPNNIDGGKFRYEAYLSL